MSPRRPYDPERDDDRFGPGMPYDDLFDADGNLIEDFKSVDDVLRELGERDAAEPPDIPPE